MNYIIGTKTKNRRIGGIHGAVLTTTVGDPFFSHPDFKGKSCYTIYMDVSGAVMMSSKKTSTSFTGSELLGLGSLFLPEVPWVCNFMKELYYLQRSVMPDCIPVGEDNTSAMEILFNEMKSGKIKNFNLRIAKLRETLTDRQF